MLTPFMGVGSEVYGAVANGRRGIGIELKSAYYQQAIKNVTDASAAYRTEDAQSEMFGAPPIGRDDDLFEDPQEEATA